MAILEELNRKFKEIDLFTPYIVVFVIIVYVLLATVGYYYHIRNLEWATSLTYLYIIFGTSMFILGALFPKLIIINSPKLTTHNRNFKKNIIIIFKQVKNSSWYNKLKILLDRRVLLSIIILAIILQSINLILLGGIPLLSGYLKFKATTDLWRIAYILFLPAINILLAKYPRKRYYALFLVGLVLFAVNGYRTSTIAIIASVLITSYYVLRLKTTYVLFLILLTVTLGVILGYVAVKAIEWQTWVLNPLQLVFYRSGFTMMILDKIVHMPGFTGGELFHQALTGGHPRVTVGQVVLGYKAGIVPSTSITSTVFGPAILDFGAWGLAVQMFLLGLILRLMYSAQKMIGGVYTALYAIILAHTMIWVETGPTDSMVWFFYTLAVIALLIFARVYFKAKFDSDSKYS